MTDEAGGGPLADEAEAFLAGCYRQYLEACGHPVPAWAWVNGLAHATRHDLEQLAASLPERRGPERLIASIASELTGLSDDQLDRVQRRRLRPLERALQGSDAVSPRSEEELAAAVFTGLRHLPRPPPDEGPATP